MFPRLRRLPYSGVLLVTVSLACLSRWNRSSTDLACRSESEPSVPETHYTIPRILHQTWPTTEVPDKVAMWIRSWIEHNPAWEYWFWTNEDIETFLTVHYPGYLHTYHSYDLSIKRADAMRYFILHEFGGVYVDVDMECLRPLDDWVSRFDCFLSEENYEHQALVYHRKDPIIITSMMGCRPRHPLYKLAIRSLPASATVADVLTATGPFFLTRVLANFRRTNATISHYVTMLPPRYLSPVPDPGQRDYFKKYCAQIGITQADKVLQSEEERNVKGLGRRERKKTLAVFKPSFDLEQSKRELEICSVLAMNNFDTSIGHESLAVHHWIHTMLNETRWKHDEYKIRIKDLAPGVISYTRLLNKTCASKYFSGI